MKICFSHKYVNAVLFRPNEQVLKMLLKADERDNKNILFPCSRRNVRSFPENVSTDKKFESFNCIINSLLHHQTIQRKLAILIKTLFVFRCC